MACESSLVYSTTLHALVPLVGTCSPFPSREPPADENVVQLRTLLPLHTSVFRPHLFAPPPLIFPTRTTYLRSPSTSLSSPLSSSSTWNAPSAAINPIEWQWYPGVVEGFGEEGNAHRVHFDDNEHVSLHLDRMQVRQREGTRETERQTTIRCVLATDHPVCYIVVITQSHPLQPSNKETI